MYTLCLIKDFIANHYLIGGDWGPENSPHAHHYKLEVRLSSAELDDSGYLVDLVEVESHLDGILAKYRDCMLNDLHYFKGKNPSLELFCRLIWEDFAGSLRTQVDIIDIRLWENDFAWAQWNATPP